MLYPKEHKHGAYVQGISATRSKSTEKTASKECYKSLLDLADSLRSPNTKSSSLDQLPYSSDDDSGLALFSSQSHIDDGEEGGDEESSEENKPQQAELSRDGQDNVELEGVADKNLLEPQAQRRLSIPDLDEYFGYSADDIDETLEAEVTNNMPVHESEALDLSNDRSGSILYPEVLSSGCVDHGNTTIPIAPYPARREAFLRPDYESFRTTEFAGSYEPALVRDILWKRTYDLARAQYQSKDMSKDMWYACAPNGEEYEYSTTGAFNDCFNMVCINTENGWRFKECRPTPWMIDPGYVRRPLQGSERHDGQTIWATLGLRKPNLAMQQEYNKPIQPEHQPAKRWFDDICREQGDIHHYNFMLQAVYKKSNTPPEVSLWAAYSGNVRRLQSRSCTREAVIASMAGKFLDPFVYEGPTHLLLQKRGTALRDAVTGYVEKVYDGYGTWATEYYGLDEIKPRLPTVQWDVDGTRRTEPVQDCRVWQLGIPQLVYYMLPPHKSMDYEAYKMNASLRLPIGKASVEWVAPGPSKLSIVQTIDYDDGEPDRVFDEKFDEEFDSSTVEDSIIQLKTECDFWMIRRPLTFLRSLLPALISVLALPLLKIRSSLLMQTYLSEPNSLIKLLPSNYTIVELEKILARKGLGRPGANLLALWIADTGNQGKDQEAMDYITTWVEALPDLSSSEQPNANDSFLSASISIHSDQSGAKTSGVIENATVHHSFSETANSGTSRFRGFSRFSPRSAACSGLTITAARIRALACALHRT